MDKDKIMVVATMHLGSCDVEFELVYDKEVYEGLSYEEKVKYNQENLFKRMMEVTDITYEEFKEDAE